MNQWTTQEATYGRTFADTVLAALKTVPGGPLIAAAKVRLSMDPAFAPTPDNKIADFTPNEANYSGYAAGGVALTLAGTGVASPGCEVEYAAVVFTATAATPFVPNNVTGYWIDDGTNVIAAEAFGSSGPWAVAQSGDFLQLDLRLPLQLHQATI